MKYTRKNPVPENKRETEKRNFFSEFMGGEFLLSKQARKWYPYLLLLCVMVAVLVVNERSIITKQRSIKAKENLYKKEISNLKKNNKFIPYEEREALINMMKEKGYSTSEKGVYQIVVNEKIEENE